jgi:hypothetical protein
MATARTATTDDFWFLFAFKCESHVHQACAMRALKCNKRLSQRDPSGAELHGITRLIINTDANVNWRIAPVPLCAATTVLKCYYFRFSQQVLYCR